MPHETNIERDYLAACRLDNTIIDAAIQAGLTTGMFASHVCQNQWQLMLAMRLSGTEVSDASLYAEAHKRGLLASLGGVDGIISGTAASTLGAATQLEAILDLHAKRESWKLLHKAVEHLESNTADMAEIQRLAGAVAAMSSGQRGVQRSVADIDQEIEADVKAAQEGKTGGPMITWGLPKLDKYLCPIERHEYVLVCGRPSRGKSSMLTHIAGTNLMQGKRIAYFTLETSDKAVVRQMAAQMARVNLKQMGTWMPQHFTTFKKAREAIRDSGRLMVFDRDMTLEAIEARCRLLATSYKPDAVVLDYLGLVGTKGKSIYERVSTASKAMIPLRKVLGCPLIVGQQLNRAAEAQEREPSLSDLRDSGQLEVDAARVVMLHWKDSRYLDQETRAYKVLQPKMRDGPTTAVDGIEFHAPTTTWREASL
jgi:replicative DNA helicase